MDFCVPQTYGDNKIVLMVRDPNTLYSYWEIRKEVEDKVYEIIRQRGLTPASSILRVYDLTGTLPDVNPKIFKDFELRGWPDNWYIDCVPGRSWMVEIGILCQTGEFFTLARSNVVHTPTDIMSDTYDDEWQEIYNKLFATIEFGSSSLDIREYLESHLRKWLSSGGISSAMHGSAHLTKGRK